MTPFLVLLMVLLCSLSLTSAARRPKPPPEPVVVLVTGSSTGIGKSTVMQFASDTRFKVYASMRRVEVWDQPEAENVVVVQMDVTSDSSVGALVARIIESEGKIDVVVNNAGYGMAGCLEVVTIEEAQKVFEVNVWGVVRVLQAVLPHMRDKRSGHCIQISSTSGIRGVPCMEYYTGSKFALEGITDSMRYSLAPFNVSVTNVNAGPVRTNFTDRFGQVEAGGRGTRQVQDSTGYLQTLTQRMIAGLSHRIASAEGQTAEEIGQLVHNLALLRLKTSRLTDVPFNIGF